MIPGGERLASVSARVKLRQARGTLGAVVVVVVLLLWLYLSAFAILLGAELDAALEHQTLRDSTAGPEQPFGRHRVTVADTVPSNRKS